MVHDVRLVCLCSVIRRTTGRLSAALSGTSRVSFRTSRRYVLAFVSMRERQLRLQQSSTLTPPKPALAAEFNLTYDLSAYGDKNSPIKLSYPTFIYPTQSS